MTRPGPAEWHAYLWPGTTVLRNKLGITGADELREYEHRAVELRAREIASGAHHISRTLDTDHLAAIHAQLFGDLYDWAGRFRQVNISKTGPDGITHHFGDHNSMDMYLRQIRAAITGASWDDLTPADAVALLADIHTRLNFAHPFREGNGRSTRIFMRHLAEHGGYQLAFGHVSAREWNTASAATFLHPYGLRLDSQPLVEIYRKVLVIEGR